MNGYVFLVGLVLMVNICFAQDKKQNNFEDWTNKPLMVTVENKNSVPSDAIVLFDDKLDAWQFVDGTKVSWEASKGGFTVQPGTPDIKTKQVFGSCQLHVEWRVPKDEDKGETLDWGNSGLKFMGLYEVQVYNSYNDIHKIYYNGQAASIYKQHSPMVNCCKPPGEWESFDIIFTAPEFYEDGSVKRKAAFTVMQNGVLVHNHVLLKGTTSHGKFTTYKKHDKKLPLIIQSHGSAVEYRNIWIREI